MNDIKVLVVDDDPGILFAFQEILSQEGFCCITAMDGSESIHLVEAEKPQVVFMDIHLPGINGLAALKRIRESDTSTEVIIITGEGNMQTTIQAMQYGAFEYLTKPLSTTKVRDSIRRVLKSKQSAVVNRSFYISEPCNRYALIGDSIAMQDIYKLIGSISMTPNHTSVLVTGESGTGKELVARAIHNNSSCAEEPFVAINCTALPETLLESELFGHEKGAFTGAAERKRGKFELSKNGTLFLDEIGDLPSNLQQKLLRVLQEREIQPLGGHNTIKVNSRFIAATNQNIAGKVEKGEFREDLFYRLNVVNLLLPPLRDRKEDIELLAHFFLHRYNAQFGKAIKGFSEEALEQLRLYTYPGNVRELENLIEQALMLSKGDVILADAFTGKLTPPGHKPFHFPIISNDFSKSRDYIMDMFEVQFINEQLKKCKGNVSAAAKCCNMSRQNFHRLLLKHRITAHNQTNE